MTGRTQFTRILPFLYIVLAFLTLRTLIHVFGSELQDFTYYLAAADNLLTGKDPYFTYPIQVYPPASLLLFIPFRLLPPSVSHSLWTIISLSSLLLSLKIFSLYIFKKIPFSHLFLIFLISLQTFPVKYALAQGQINFLVFLTFALLFHFLSTKKYHLAGLILALAVTLKFNPILLLPFLLVTGNTKSLPAFFLSFILMNLFIDLLFPPSLINSFLQSVTRMSTNYAGYYYNTSLASLSIRLFDQSTAIIVNLILSAGIFSVTFFTSLKAKRDLLIYMLIIVTILLVSPITWQHYLFWTIPAFLLLFRSSSSLNFFLAILSFVLINFNLKDPQQLAMQNPLYSHVTFGLLLLFFVLILENKTPSTVRKALFPDLYKFRSSSPVHRRSSADSSP